MAWTRFPRRPVAVVALAIGALGGCTEGTDSSTECGPITREALDPAYLVHIINDELPVDYTSDPPTSGPHKPSPPATGVVDRSLSRPVQVGILERGDVLLQYSPELSRTDQAALEALADAGVVVAPSPDLPDTIVATAWRSKRICGALTIEDLEEFVTERSGQGP